MALEEKIEVSEEELSSLVKDYTEMNKRLSIPLPEGNREYGFAGHLPRTDGGGKDPAFCEAVHSP